MKNIILKLLKGVVLLFAISLVCFLLIQMMPSDPVEVVLRIRQTPAITEAMLHETIEELGLNYPMHIRYLRWIYGVMTLDLGNSYIHPSRTVIGELSKALPNTLYLAGSSILIICLVAVPIGLLSGMNPGSVFDTVIKSALFLLTAMPVYWLALLMVWYFSLTLKWLPSHGIGGLNYVILPAVATALGHIAIYIRMIRSKVIEIMTSEYILYARSRGIRGIRLVVFYVFKNAIRPSLTALGMNIPQLMAGALVIENIFAWPGLGRLCIEAVLNRDYPILQAYVLLMSVLFLLSNAAFGCIQRKLDPTLIGRGKL